MSKYTIGFAYVLSNSAMPSMIKVGFTLKLPEDRAKDLYTTGVPVPFDIEFRAATSYPDKVEKQVHGMLAPLRVSPQREFFRVSVNDAVETIGDARLDVASIDAWSSDEPHKIRHGDRIAITMQAGDLFIVLAYRYLWSEQPEPHDWWQAHADGDLLELMGTDEPGYVAGVSDYDPGAEMDPVPYLDRSDSMPNGSINGRERLVPGDRLLWLRPMCQGEVCKLATFEMYDHCQVISRTWDPQSDPSGWPLLLNFPTLDELPPCVVRTVRAALRMGRPRTWAPRNSDPDDGWVMTATDAAPPEYWFSQLQKRRRKR
jgi:hypothetical protein